MRETGRERDKKRSRREARGIREEQEARDKKRKKYLESHFRILKRDSVRLG